MLSDTIVMILTFAFYLLGMAVIGYIAYKRTKNSSDFFLGSRSLGPWVTALSAGASDMSGWLLFALPGLAYSTGVSAIWNIIGLLGGTYFNWIAVAKRLRLYSRLADNSVTIPTYISARLCDHGGQLKKIAALFILVFFSIYTGSGLVASGKLFSSVFGIDYHLAISIGAVAIVSYTLFGGFLAVSWTDLVQGLLMSAALAIVPVAALYHVGGFASTIMTMQTLNPNLLSPTLLNSHYTVDYIAIISFLAWGLGYIGQPHILVRFKAIRSIEDLPKARRIAMTWTSCCIIGAVMSGMAGISYFDVPINDPEKVYLALVNAIFHPSIAGILLAAILAAVMSTADSQLLVASSALAEDLYKGWLRPTVCERELIIVSRLAVASVTLVAMVLAWNPSNKVLDLASYAWAGFGASFGPVILLSLYWRGLSRQGALASMLTGATVVLFWRHIEGGIFELYEILPGFLLASGAAFIFSRIYPPDHETIALYSSYESALLNQSSPS